MSRGVVLYFVKIYRILGFLRWHLFLKITLGFFCLLVIGCGAFLYFEGNMSHHINSFSKVFQYLFTISAVGFGEYYPQTLGGKITVMFVIFVMMTFVALFSAALAAVFIEFKVKMEMGMANFNLSGHIVVVGWNLKGQKIIETIREQALNHLKPFLVVANEERKPPGIKHLYFVKSGNPVSMADLDRACIKRASKVIILADYSQKSGSDAFSAVNCLMVRNICKDVEITAEILNPAAREYLEAAGANQIIGIGEIGGLLIANSTIHKDISKVAEEISEAIKVSHH